MGEIEVDLAGTAKYLNDLLNFDAVQFWVKVERAELGDEKLQVRPCRSTSTISHDVGVQAHAN